MSLASNIKEWRLVARTDLWTGDADRKGERVISTGLLGSIRWWFEVLVRGLKGSACDPTNPANRCLDSWKKPSEPGHRCVVCELFGCTGWARKFRFEVLGENDQVKVSQIKKKETFKLCFTELRAIRPEEWALLDLTLRLIADYGAIGGKTVLKPSDEASRANAPHHRNYGLIRIEEPPARLSAFTQKELEDYICQDRWRRVNHGDFVWASLENFWCVNGRHLARQATGRSTFNKVLGRKEGKADAQQLEAASRAVNAWLAGRQRESKKIFSFKDPPRTFGFVDPDRISFGEVQQRLKQVWGSLGPGEFLTGEAVLAELMGQEGRT